MKIDPCVQCGYCCRNPCSFGAFNEERSKCKFLTNKNLCGKYEEIKKTVPDWQIYPAFGAGCCSSLFNAVRANAIKRRNLP